MTQAPPIKTIMLIDDEEIDQMLYERMLKRSNMVDTVLSFSYASEALDYLAQPKRDPVEVIFLDINMPRMDGFEFLEAATNRLGEDFAKAVIVMLTTSLNPADHQRASQFDVVKEFINKPLTVEHLQNVARLLDNSEPF